MNSDMDIQRPNSSINYTLAPGDRLLQCPYVRSHQILEKKFVTHLNKCRNNYRKMMKTKGSDFVKMATCRWNFCHQLPEIELEIHEETCPDAHQYLYELQQLKSINMGKHTDEIGVGSKPLAPSLPQNRPQPVLVKWDSFELLDEDQSRGNENGSDLDLERSKTKKSNSPASVSTLSSSFQDFSLDPQVNDNDSVGDANSNASEDSEQPSGEPESSPWKKASKEKEPLKLNTWTSPWNKLKPPQPADSPSASVGETGQEDNNDLDEMFPKLESVLQPSAVQPSAFALKWSVLHKPDYGQDGGHSSWDNRANDGNGSWQGGSSGEDDWDMYTEGPVQAPTYDPKIKLQQENVLFMPRGMTKSERKAYREKARLRLINTTERLTSDEQSSGGHIPVGAEGWRH